MSQAHEPPDDPNAPGGPGDDSDPAGPATATAEVIPIKRKRGANAAPQLLPTAGDWKQLLRIKHDGSFTRDPGNAALLLTNDPEWSGCIHYDEFSARIIWHKSPPLIMGLLQPVPGEQLADQHIVYAQHWLARYRNVSFSADAVNAALSCAASVNKYHPVRDYLQALQWDGQLRIHKWLQDYLGAPDDEYIHHVGRLWLISAVARVMQPGCQVDYMLVLEGKQGIGKSTAARILAGEWYLPSVPDLQNKDSSAALRGKWIAEFAELDAMHRAELTRVKEYLTRTVDSYRPVYERHSINQLRQTVFLGTTNDTNWNKDETGEARRFWPIPCTALRRAELLADRDQLWAEAYAAHTEGIQWHPQEDMLGGIIEAQELRHHTDDWDRRIASWLDGSAEATARNDVLIGDILSGPLGIEPGKQDKAVQTRVGQALKRLGWKKQRLHEHGVKVSRYFRA